MSLWPPGLQHTRLPCPSLSSGVCSNLCPLSWWCYLTISSSAIPFSFGLQSFPASGSFPRRNGDLQPECWVRGLVDAKSLRRDTKVRRGLTNLIGFSLRQVKDSEVKWGERNLIWHERWLALKGEGGRFMQDSLLRPGRQAQGQGRALYSLNCKFYLWGRWTDFLGPSCGNWCKN